MPVLDGIAFGLLHLLLWMHFPAFHVPRQWSVSLPNIVLLDVQLDIRLFASHLLFLLRDKFRSNFFRKM